MAWLLLPLRSGRSNWVGPHAPPPSTRWVASGGGVTTVRESRFSRGNFIQPPRCSDRPDLGPAAGPDLGCRCCGSPRSGTSRFSYRVRTVRRDRSDVERLVRDVDSL